MGTNGIGTALEGGQPMHVFGHEHYAEDLRGLGVRRRTDPAPDLGQDCRRVDLTCWRSDAGPLLMTLAKTTAGQIRQALLADAAAKEIELLQEYLRVCRRTSGIVIALNNEVVMMNDYARTVLAPADQAALLQQATEALAGRRRSFWSIFRPERGFGCTPGRWARRCRPGASSAKVAQVSTPKRRTAVRRRRCPTSLIGSGALWRRAATKWRTPTARVRWPSLASLGLASWPSCVPCTSAGTPAGGSPC